MQYNPIIYIYKYIEYNNVLNRSIYALAKWMKNNGIVRIDKHAEFRVSVSMICGYIIRSVHSTLSGKIYIIMLIAFLSFIHTLHTCMYV